MEKAKKATETPVFVVTPEEAKKAEQGRSKDKKTWVFKADNVRDFAFASSRKFIWDAMAVEQSGKTILAMSLYPKEGNPLWEKYSTRVVAHTLQQYSKYTFDYPYPVAWSVHTNRIGMEYPMMCFNGGRPEADGTYSARTKHGMISVIIHEVGHNYFPMIVNSDERQWTWMDEGLNTFVQSLTEKAIAKNKEKKVEEIILDPFRETADTDRNNNYWPERKEPTRFELFKQSQYQSKNPMQQAKQVEKMKSKGKRPEGRK